MYARRHMPAIIMTAPAGLAVGTCGLATRDPDTLTYPTDRAANAALDVRPFQNAAAHKVSEVAPI
jgi:hypothetical protein